MRGAINQFELLLLEQVKKDLKAKVQMDEEPVKLKELHRWIREEQYPYFHFMHLPRGPRTLPAMLMSIDSKWVIRPGRGKEGGSVMTPKQQEKAKEMAHEETKELRFAYCQLIELLVSIGPTVDFSLFASKWNDIIKITGFKRDKYGFRKFIVFVNSCPGIVTIGTQSVKLENENPEELTADLAEYRRKHPRVWARTGLPNGIKGDMAKQFQRDMEKESMGLPTQGSLTGAAVGTGRRGDDRLTRSTGHPGGRSSVQAAATWNGTWPPPIQYYGFEADGSSVKGGKHDRGGGGGGGGGGGRRERRRSPPRRRERSRSRGRRRKKRRRSRS